MAVSCEKPAWALDVLRRAGLRPDTSMDDDQKAWWSWFSCDNEYYSQDKTGSRAPQQDILGNCWQPCAGDSSQVCGGSAALSVYRRCADGDAYTEGDRATACDVVMTCRASLPLILLAAGACLALIVLASLLWIGITNIPLGATKS